MDVNKTSLARIKIKFPEQLWISEVIKKFPDLKMEILSFLPYDLDSSIGNAIVEILHYKIDSIVAEIKNHNSVLEFNILEQEDNRIKFNIKIKDAYLLYIIIQCGIIVIFPIRIREGYAFWKLIASRERIDKLLTVFEQKEIEFSLLKIGKSEYSIDDNDHKLSLDELNVLETAIKLGFFEVPRKISLEELANTVGKSKSALSVVLRKIIKKKVLFMD